MESNSKYNLEHDIISEKSKLMYKHVLDLASTSSDNILFTVELNREGYDYSTYTIADYNKDKGMITILNNKNELNY